MDTSTLHGTLYLSIAALYVHDHLAIALLHGLLALVHLIKPVRRRLKKLRDLRAK